MAVFQLNNELWFPDPQYGEPSGLVAVGGDLSVARLLLAYSNGYFPWYDFLTNREPLWYCPLDRFVIFPDEIHISHSMKQLMRKNLYTVTFNQAFEKVINACAEVDHRNLQWGAWLGSSMINAYIELHKRGYAVSAEVWESNRMDSEGEEPKLVGGLYGVSLRNAFFGESMFSLVPNASKLALISLAQALTRSGGVFIDCQFETPHLLSMGGRHISYEEYMKLLNGDKQD